MRFYDYPPTGARLKNKKGEFWVVDPSARVCGGDLGLRSLADPEDIHSVDLEYLNEHYEPAPTEREKLAFVERLRMVVHLWNEEIRPLGACREEWHIRSHVDNIGEQMSMLLQALRETERPLGEDTPITPELLHDLLGLVIEDPPSEAFLASRTPQEREDAEKWAAAVHLRASDNEGVVVPEKPSWLDQMNEQLIWWLSQAEMEAIGKELPDTMPEVLRSEYRSMQGRPMRGRLWCPAELMGSGNRVIEVPFNSTPLGRYLENSGGIVFLVRHRCHLVDFPGTVTDWRLHPR